MINNLMYWVWKYLTGPTSHNACRWQMSEARTIKYVDTVHNVVLYTLEFNIETDMCVLHKRANVDIFEIPIIEFEFKDCLQTLKKKELLNNWQPTWANYSDTDLAMLQN